MLLPTVAILALIATVAVLLVGTYSMGHGGTFDDRHSGQFMSARVALQLVAFLLVMLAVLIAG